MQKTTRSSGRFQTVVMSLVLVSLISPSISSLSAATVNQEPAHAAAPAPAQTENLKAIPDGTEFMVVTVDEITSKTAAEGDPLTFKVAEDLKIDGQTVVAKGTIVK